METELARIREFGGDPKTIIAENEKLKTQNLTFKRESTAAPSRVFLAEMDVYNVFIHAPGKSQ